MTPPAIHSEVLSSEPILYDLEVPSSLRKIISQNAAVSLEETLLPPQAPQLRPVRSPEIKLLNKPNQSERDRAGMKAAIAELKQQGMWDQEAVDFLDKVSYGMEYKHHFVKIGKTKWVPKTLEIDSLEPATFDYNDLSYLPRNTSIETTLRKQNKSLAEKHLKIASDGDYDNSFEALPGASTKKDLQTLGNVLALLTGVSSAYPSSDGELFYRTKKNIFPAAVSVSGETPPEILEKGTYERVVAMQLPAVLV